MTEISPFLNVGYSSLPNYKKPSFSTLAVVGVLVVLTLGIVLINNFRLKEATKINKKEDEESYIY
jgi:hypothetical protein